MPLAMMLSSRLRAGIRTMLAARQSDLAGRALGTDGFRVGDTYPHDATAFTQGLAFADGELYESTGLYGASTLRRIDRVSGRVLAIRRLPAHTFAEGIAVVADRIVQLTWREGKGLVYDRRNLKLVDTFRYRGEGWGLAFDGQRLIMSDGTSRLRFLDPTTFAETGAVEVHCDGRGVGRLNDLVAVCGEILVNVHGQDRLARVLPDGRVAGWIDLQPLRELPGMRGRDQVANGVAWDPVRARLLVTGKHWPRLFEIVPPPAHPGAAPELRVALHRSMGEIPRSDWDALAADDVLASHGWLATLESTRLGGGTPIAVTVYDGARLVGGAGCLLAVQTDAVETLDHVLFGRLRGVAAPLGLSLLPALVCGPSRGSGCHPLLARGLAAPARDRILDLILDAIEGEAARRGVRPCFADVHAGGDLACRLRARSYLMASDTPTNVLDVAWSSFDTYLRHLDQITRGARKDVRRQMNQNAKRGTTIVTLEEPELAGDRLHELMTLNERAHNGRPFGFSRDFFRVLRQQLGSDAVFYAARKGERITAVALLLRRGRIGHLPMVGVDHAAAGRDFTFFSVAHYRPIADAIADGMRTLYMGRALYDLKARRGCRLEDTQVFYRPSGRRARMVLAAWFFVLSRWNRSKLAPRARRRRPRELRETLN